MILHIKKLSLFLIIIAGNSVAITDPAVQPDIGSSTYAVEESVCVARLPEWKIRQRE